MAAQPALERPAREWAERFDANSMVVLADAASHFDVRQRVAEICARLLLVQCTTDAIFPPDEATQALLKQVPGPTRFHALDSPYGHMAPGVEWRQLEDDLYWLLA